MASVFLSSTGYDLAEYRQGAIEVCNQLAHVPVAMEFFESMGVGATEGSRRKLEGADVYVGIFAYRYGYVEPGYPASVTELEFDHAEQLGLDRLCFVVDPAHPWPPDAIDYEQRDRLKALKRRVDRLIRPRFTTVSTLKLALMQSLVAWERARGGPPARKEQLAPPPSRAPAAPALLLGRARDLGELRARLGVGTARARRLAVVRGWPGVGKTTVVNALVHDPEVRGAFPDGVLWAALGPEADPLAELRRWAGELRAPLPPGPAELGTVMAAVGAALVDRAALLVVDDAWRADDAIPFKRITGPRCGLLAATRFPDVARELADVPAEDEYRLGVLTEDDALDLLRRYAPLVVQRLPSEARQLVRDLEGLPLALRVAGRLLVANEAVGTDPRTLMAGLRESHRLLDERAPEDRFVAATGTTPTLDLLLELSTRTLDPAARERFALLGAFAPKPATFDLEAIAHVWADPRPLPTVRTLVDRGLLEPLPGRGRFQIHALLVMHAQRLLERL